MNTQNSASPQTMGFQTEVKQLLQLMIHSLYSNKEIFLRELISNASDACDKLRFASIDNPTWLVDDPTLRIQIAFDKDAKTLTITDNGIGLSRDEAIAHLGTIAKSGTKEFFSKLTGDQAKDAQLIGQFGVGFYSAFMVADQVVVRSRRAGLSADEGVEWISAGDGEFTINTVPVAQRGTQITLHLKADESEFAERWRLSSIIRKYSDHISLPIEMKKEEWNEEEKKQVMTDEWEAVNQASALWTRSKNDITEEQYQEFYKSLTYDYQNPLKWTHNRVEGRSEYTQLLYIPAKAPMDMWDRNQKRGLKLYVKRVFIMEDAEQLLPVYLRFVKGIIDSQDLPLNVSREILQESRDVKAIREGSTKKVLGMLEDLADNTPEQYATFWAEFGQVLKEGIGEDHSNKERIAKLLRFASTHDDSGQHSVSLTDYVGRMQSEQTQIYYITADSYAAAAHSPHLEIFRKKGIEVLLLSDRVDEWMLSFLTEFEEKKLQSIAKGDLDMSQFADANEKEAQEQQQTALKPLLERCQEVLKDKAKEVRLTFRLTDSPACLVAENDAMSGYLQRMLKQAGQAAPTKLPILELNPEHALVKKIEGLNADNAQFADWVNVIFDQAMLAEGGQLDNPSAFVKRLNSLLV